MKRPPIDTMFGNGAMPRDWAAWYTTAWNVLDSVENSGITADRPVKDLFIGRPYFDTTLGKPIWLKSVRPTVWVTADGVAA